MSDFKLIEEKWQKYWAADASLWRAKDFSKKPKVYILNEFPYPSGSGLHVGHAFSFVGGDVYARYRRMQGDNVLFPMGWDAFGLPTENYAIKMKRKPQEVTKENTDMFRNQMKRLAFSYDWDREINTTDPAYYKWTQWIFIQLFKKGLAYKKEMPINWCPSCKIGLANEEVVDSKCERCGSEVSKRNISQWIVKITEYADKLIEGLKETKFIDKVKQSQINWIGKSQGAIIRFKIQESRIKNQELEVFTTRPDTLFGATFMVVAPEHELVRKLISEVVISKTKKDEIEKYVANSRKKSEMERTEVSKDKTGIFSGLYAINPVNNKEIPIWISDFVLASYGTGAIMSVPAHDERDYDFAQKYDLEINQVLAPIMKITEGKDAIRQGKPTVDRNTVHVFVKHWSEDKFLCLDWKNFGWKSGVIGGVNEKEDWLDAAKREVKEETGYVNMGIEKDIGLEVHNHFFAVHKDENRYAVGRGFVFKLKDDQKQLTDKDDTKHHDLVWVDASEMDSYLNLDSQKFLWKTYKSGNSCFTDDGVLINSDFLNGLDQIKAFEKMIKWLEDKKIGERSASYHLRDWIFSRQHYWGEPIPMIFCEHCKNQLVSPSASQPISYKEKIKKYGEEHNIDIKVLENNPGWYPVEEKQLPIVLPEVEAYEPTDDGQSPLSKIESFVKCKCPVCGEEASRETDTMPNWAGSDWYYLAYCFANKIKANDIFGDIFSDSQKEIKYWGPVDVYIGGDEHNVLHLLYSRFIYQFLWDLGVLPKDIKEPYYKRISHGVILGPDGQRMSKSKGNVIVPEVVADKYGVDVVRMYLMFMGPFDSTMAWNENTLMGVKRFLDRFNQFIRSQISDLSLQKEKNIASSKEVKVIINKLIDTVSKDLENFKYNTAIAKLMEALNSLSAIQPICLSDEDIKTLIKLIAPLAPYTAEELWASMLGVNKDLPVQDDYVSVHLTPWPMVEEKYLIEDTIIVAVAVNGKVRSQISVDRSQITDKNLILSLAKDDEKIKKWLGEARIVKEIYVVGKMVNLVIQ